MSLHSLAAQSRQSQSNDEDCMKGDLDKESVFAELISSVLPESSALAEYVLYRDSLQVAHYGVFVLQSASKTSELQFRYVGEAKEIDAQISIFLDGIRTCPTNPESQSEHLESVQTADPDSMWLSAGDWLRRLLVDSLMMIVGSSVTHLFVAPDGAIGKIPFAALPGPMTGYVLDWDLCISYLSSGRDLLHVVHHQQDCLQNPSRNASLKHTSLVVADPDFEMHSVSSEYDDRNNSARGELCWRETRDLRESPGFADLPSTQAEGEWIAEQISVMQGVKAELLTQQLAKAEALYNADGPLILHIATHCFFLSIEKCASQHWESSLSSSSQPQQDEIASTGWLGSMLSRIENPLLRSGLAFAGARAWQEEQRPFQDVNTGIVTADDLCSVDLRGTELVVLSVCDTGEVTTWNSMAGLGRAFMLAGAKSLLLSLWYVDDKNRVDLFSHFYSNLSAAELNMWRAKALRDAQRKIRHQNPMGLSSHPYYWGAFVLYGSPGFTRRDDTNT
eukprot:gnl/MRDRNA2_/MRDRNA2_16532_c0_seq1.p1 gnl/MRDRNA2_/MRDRNA2_16532_c0~~gnl/MRDRNA2_/MRDRNA2_16532_c0_seq1.p1  ORF type:complete len:558 (-),score=112.10 gnl/MRDRNA2_/MRDRNA2_16532_c0_seq1:96-1610(-)